MWVKQIALKNWGPFRGQHEVKLDRGVYGLIARTEDDLGRSNWQGKTWFLNAILFALSGKLPSDCETKDDWITHGESEGFVRIWLEGLTICRSKKLGKSEQLNTFEPIGSIDAKEAKQKAAQAIIDRAIGFDGDGLLAGSFIRQKQIDRLVQMRSGDLTEVINGWLELEPLEKAEEHLRKLVSSMVGEEAGLEREIATAAENEKLEEADAENWALQLEASQGVLTKLVAEAKRIGEWQAIADQAYKWKEVNLEGKKLSQEIGESSEEEFKALELEGIKYAGELSEFRRQIKLEEKLVCGGFEGVCPLDSGECPQPAVERINQNNSLHSERLQQLNEKFNEVDSVYRKKFERRTTLTRQEDTRKRTEGQLVQLRKREQELRPAAVQMGKMGGPPPEISQHPIIVETEKVELLKIKLATIATQQVMAVRCKETNDKRRTKLAELKKELEVHRQALAIVGRNGAQKDIAEQALGTIEQGANELLAVSGIDLSIAIKWSREAKGLAVNCDECGAPFPISQRVKKCEHCDAPRGPKTQNKLQLKLSNRSGAAEDLAGLAFQLAGSQWLKASRGSQWGLTCIDEPFGALDSVNARQLSTSIATMLNDRYAFEQAIIVAHDRALMDALPHRIVITGSAAGSKVEVVG